jgi:hypothetical protein
MFEVTYSVNGVESLRNVRAETQEKAVAVIMEENPEACIVRITGPWKVDA